MDPYLEGDSWPSFHSMFVVEVSFQLNRRLRPNYIALPERKYFCRTGPHFRIDVRAVPSRRIVTAVEFLSPASKGRGRNAYLGLRRRLLLNQVHLLEIDLHHEGKRAPLRKRYPDAAYFVLLSRAHKR